AAVGGLSSPAVHRPCGGGRSGLLRRGTRVRANLGEVDVSAREIAEYVLLALGGGIEVLSAIGVLAMRNAYERLHYVASAGVGSVGVPLMLLLTIAKVRKREQERRR